MSHSISHVARRRTVLGQLLAGAGALAIGRGATAQHSKAFNIGYQKGGILAVAKHKGAIESRLGALGVANVKWIEFQYGPPLLEALGIGSIDFGTVGDTPPIFAQAAGAKVVYVAATPAAQSALLVPESSPIRSLADLKGKKIAFARGSSSHNLTVQLLAKAGLAWGDITPLYLNPADAAAAFARGSTDAWTIWDPYFAIAERRHKARVVATTKDVEDSNSFYLANADYARQNPAVVRTVIDELAKVTQWGADNRGELAAHISAVTGVELEAQRIAVERADIRVTPLTEKIIAQQQKIADTFQQLGLIPRPIVVREIVWRPSAS